MSNQTQRIKHSQRLLRKKAAVKKQVKIAKSHNLAIKKPHRFTKQHAMDCGRPHCRLCSNPRRIWKERSVQETSFDQTAGWQDE